MGFLSRYAGTDRIDVTDLADPDGNEYYVEVKKSLTGDEWDRAEAAHVQVAANVTAKTGKAARSAAARRRAAQGPGEESDEQDLTTLLKFDTPAYRRAVLDAGIVEWNLTDQHGRPLLLRPALSRAQSIAALPAELRQRLFEHLEASKPAPREPDEDADFRERVPVGGQDGALGASADQGDLAAPGVVAVWADAGGGVGDLRPV